MMRTALLIFSTLFFSIPAVADDGDIIARRGFSADRDALQATIADIRNHETLWPEGCIARFELGEKTEGVGASAVWTYKNALFWSRRLTAVLTEIEPRRIVQDHPGNKGFVTTYDFTEIEQGIQVEMHTWIKEPPRPFKRAFFKRIQPRWQECQAGYLNNLAQMVSS